MILKEEVWEERPTIDIVLVSGRVIGCDSCGKEVGQSGEGLELTLFREGCGPSESLNYCCWQCVADGLSKVKNDSDIEFATLPYLQFDAEVWKDGQHVSDFLKLCGK